MYLFYTLSEGRYYCIAPYDKKLVAWDEAKNTWIPCQTYAVLEDDFTWYYQLTPSRNKTQYAFVIDKKRLNVTIKKSIRDGLFMTDPAFYPLNKIENPRPESDPGLAINAPTAIKAGAFCVQPKRMLSEDQRQKLKAHQKILKNRALEFRFFSYLFGDCFGKCYSRSEKINEINNVLNGQAFDEAVLMQGRTGRLLRG